MQKLYTAAGRALPDIPWDRYPRPQLVRADWLCLNGTWTLSWAGRETNICVPFCPESLLSGVEVPPAIGEQMTYRRSFRIPDSWRGRRVLLHFGAVGRECRVFVNDTEVARHDSGYLSFSADITDALRPGDNELAVTAVNDLDRRFPWGKQSGKRGGMWYTPVSGIWQTVWIEPVPEHYIHALRIETDAEGCTVRCDGACEGTLLFEGSEIALRNGFARIDVPSPELWSPEHPKLYRFALCSGEDAVESYFALRTLRIETVDGLPRLCLNGEPYFFNGLLDQGYWSDGLYTPASPDAYAEDILAMKSLGFNTLRKHIKVEPEQFYYDCDRLGMVVFQDMVNNSGYHYVRDTVLPTLHFQRRRDTYYNRSAEARAIFTRTMHETVEQLRNHPCICYWTIFNEGWGQFCADEQYELLRAQDPTRFIDSTSGWFHQTKSDVDSIHCYFDPQHLGKRPDRPQVISEFGGYVWKLPEHSFNREKTYGYKKFDSCEAFTADLLRLYREEILPLIPRGLCAAIYTQVSDVEDETNGLLTFDRAVCKLESETFRPLMDELCAAIRS